MNEKIKISKENKRKWWGKGAWVDEPDYEEFEYNGFNCRIGRFYMPDDQGLVFGGYLCAYVDIPKDHKLYGYYNETEDLKVHGGITYNEKTPVFHWIGFDCAHAGDITPSMSDMYFRIFFEETYKDWNYVVNEVKQLVDQLRPEQPSLWTEEGSKKYDEYVKKNGVQKIEFNRIKKL